MCHARGIIPNRAVPLRNAAAAVCPAALVFITFAACSSSSEPEDQRQQELIPFGSNGGATATPSNAAGSSGNANTTGSAGSGAGSTASTGGTASSIPSAGAGGTPGAAGSTGNLGSAGTAGSPVVGEPPLLSELCPPGSAFCEDFEDDTLDRAPLSPWQDATNGATARVSAARAFSGDQALLINVPAGPAPHRGYVALQQNNFSAANREMYGRLLVWLEATPQSLAGQNPIHWTLFQGEGRAASNNYNAIYRFGGERQNGAGLLANYETTKDGNPQVFSDCRQDSASTMPTGAWACVEWHFSASNNEVQYWLDGRELSDLHVIDRGQSCVYDQPPLNGQWLAPPAFQTLYLGWEQYQEQTNTLNVWFDDIVVSTERVGCPAP
ncbi:MAG TPA: hypothetical protein VJU61_13335 [Polyangiaceae bacterium]|nr:hypothetical protein [Polyangiaceae bacterium]